MAAPLVPKAPAGSRTRPVAPHRRGGDGAEAGEAAGSGSSPSGGMAGRFVSASRPAADPRVPGRPPADDDEEEKDTIASLHGTRPLSSPLMEDIEGSYTEIDASELEFGESVGSGATAEVFVGHWKGQQVAIKEIYLIRKKDAKSELKQQVAFMREVAVMSKVNHDNLVRFLGVSLSTRPLRIVSEFCEGDTLFGLLHEEPDVDLVWKQKLKMCSDIASAMCYLHDFRPQIIHRDLKSLNLLLAQVVSGPKDEPLVKVSDFGMARMKDADEQSEWDKMTKEAGTCHWMAPEVPTGRYTEKADVYSYAMVLFEIICREIPFEEEDGKNAIRLVMKGARPDLEAVPPDRPPALEELMVKCWAQSPKDRPTFSLIREVLAKIKF